MKTLKEKQKDVIFEIGVEEIPARFMPDMLADLERKGKALLDKNRLKYRAAHTCGTARRLTFYIEGIAPAQEDLNEELKGPPKRAAFDNEGNMTAAAEGFARSQQVKLEELEVRVTPQGEYVFAKVFRKGEPTVKILAKLFPELVSTLYLPLSMRWGEVDFRFIRPIHWILALYGTEVVKCNIAGIKAGAKTYGHRFISGAKPLRVVEPARYAAVLKKAKVMVDSTERRAAIARAVEAAAKQGGGRVFMDEELLDEVNFLTEWPAALLGEFDPQFLKLPEDVLVTSMKKTQKYFSVRGKGNKLLPKFIMVANYSTPSSASLIKRGAADVLRARLTDARFFFEEDKKVSLADRVGKLSGISFFEKLGTLLEKKDRIKELAAFIGSKLHYSEAALADIARAAELAKADLVTHMVYEFPALQGIVGREYALQEGEKPEVAQGIFEHYLPRFTGDKLPAAETGIAVALADKLDALLAAFSIGLIPSGSQDPYGLRRQAQGIVEIILRKNLDLSLKELLHRTYAILKAQFIEAIPADFTPVAPQLLDFLAQRLKNILLDEGVRYDIADAAIANLDNIDRAYQTAKVLMKFLGVAWFPGVVATADRIKRIAVNATGEEIDPAVFIEDGEREMHNAYLKIKNELEEIILLKNYEAAIKLLSDLTQPVEDFFVKVLVMHEDPKIKVNRLALLKGLENMFTSVADFARVVQ